jgi:hypothetical protein
MGTPWRAPRPKTRPVPSLRARSATRGSQVRAAHRAQEERQTRTGRTPGEAPDRATAALRAELALAGFRPSHLGELRTHPYRDALPILVRWLPRVRDEATINQAVHVAPSVADSQRAKAEALCASPMLTHVSRWHGTCITHSAIR